jgi:tetratricopeptide (TPR) repeat protein
MKTDLQTAIEYIENWNISDFFEFVKAKKGENALLNQLAKRFITNRYDENFDEQLRLLATWLLSENQMESKNAEQALLEKGTITQAEIKGNYNQLFQNIRDSTINSNSNNTTKTYNFNNGKYEIERILTSPPFIPPLFLGRDKDLATVHQRLFKGENFLMLVNGQGGIGKTSFAAKYWEKYQNDYAHLAFLFVGDDLSDTSKVSDKYSPIANALLSLSRNLGLRFTTESPTEQIQLLIETVNNLQKPCLLILDNANNEKDLKDNYIVLNKCRNFHILLTSRLDSFAKAQKYSIGVLDKENALAVFKKHYELLQEAEIPLFEEIYKAVGGNTLVLELMAKNLSNFNNKLRKKYSLQNLLDDLQKGLTKLSQSKAIDTAYQAKGTGLRNESPEVIILGMYDLTELTEAEQALLSVFAVLPAENIDFDTLTKLLQNENIDDTLLDLAQKGWIEQNETTFKTSPVIQEIVRHKNQHRLFADCEKMIDFLIDELYMDNIHKENYKYSTLYSYYGESMVNNFAEPHNYFSVLLERIGSFHKTIGNLSKAVNFYERKKEVNEKLLAQNPENPDFKNGLAISYEKLGETQSSLGNLLRALEYFVIATKLFEELYATYPTNVSFKNGLAISYQFLGNTQSDLGNLEKALEYFEKYNNLKQELYAAYPTNVSFKKGLGWSSQFLGNTHLSLGNLDNALSFYFEMNKLFEELYVAYPTNVEFKKGLAISYSKLGSTQSSLGNLEVSLKYFEKFNFLIKELYEAYPTNVSFKNGLAISYEKLGDTQSSLGNLEKALEYFGKYNDLEQELYEAYPTNVSFKNNLAISYEKLGSTQSSLGNLEKALECFEKFNKLFEELYATYPTNASFKNGLAISYSKLGDFYQNSDKQKAKMYYLECKKHYLELTKSFPAYVEFQKNLQLVESRLAGL